MHGYMEMRDEFETEMFHKAEQDVKDIAFEENVRAPPFFSFLSRAHPSQDTEEEREMKFTLLECYYARLKEREKARRFVVERQLHDQKLQEKIVKARDPEQKAANAQYKRFLQILRPEVRNRFTYSCPSHAPQQYEDFVNGIAKEKKIQAQLEKLQNYRRNGISTLVEAAAYDEELRRRVRPSYPSRLTSIGSRSEEGPDGLPAQAATQTVLSARPYGPGWP